jgi:membrane protein
MAAARLVGLLRKLWQAFVAAGKGWLEDDGARLAAALSLYSLLSLAPLVIISIAIASFAFGRLAAQDAIVHEVRGMMGAEGAAAISTVIQYGKTPAGGGLASVVGVVTLLFGASSVFGELQSGLNKVWHAAPATGSGAMALVKSRLFSFAMVLALGFLLLVSLLFSTILTALSGYLSQRLSVPTPLLATVSELVSFLGVAALIAVIFKYVPDVPLRWRHVWEGAIGTALLFVIGKTVLGVYLGKAAIGSAYGAAGSIIVVIVWVYYSAMIFYFGAEFTKVRAGKNKHAAASLQRK